VNLVLGCLDAPQGKPVTHLNAIGELVGSDMCGRVIGSVAVTKDGVVSEGSNFGIRMGRLMTATWLLSLIIVQGCVELGF